MLFALRQPATLLGLVLGYAVGLFLRATIQRLIVEGRGSLRYGGLRRAATPQLWLDPYGAVAALLAGVGWSIRPVLPFRGSKRTVWLLTIAAVVVHALLAAGGIALYLQLGGQRAALHFLDAVSVLHGTQFITTSATQRIALGFGVENLGCGLLALLPLPPLELGVALWSALPRTAGTRRLAHRLLEEQWSIAIVLVLLLLPIGGEQPLLLQLLDSVAGDILRAISPGSTLG
jgi:hypothetical protein